MQIIKCDKCGKHIEDTIKVKFPFTYNKKVVWLDICKDCQKEFIKDCGLAPSRIFGV